MKREKAGCVTLPITFHASRFTLPLLEIVDHGLRAVRLERFLHELEMLRMHLICLFRLLVWEDQVQRNLITLLHDRSRAGGHFADMKLQHVRDVLEIFIRAGNDFISGVGFGRVGPKNDNV